MGWRFRKRIKILPGIHINISKSGFSTNVGVKGASVTFGQNGTYINTGLPGTGLYRRDKISGSSLENNEHENCLCSVPLNDGGLEVVAPKRGSFLCFLKNLIRKIGLLHDDRQEEISVFTHQGDLVKLPQGATILDYAYYIHSSVGSQCVGACVNNKNVSLFYQLQDGDRVDIKTSPIQEPQQKWLDFVRTDQAKEQILQTLCRKQEKGESCADQNVRRILDSSIMDTESSKGVEKTDSLTLSNLDNAEAKNAQSSVGNTKEKLKVSQEVNGIEKECNQIEYGDIHTPYNPKLDLEHYKYPTLNLLKKSDDQGPQIDMMEQNANNDRIIEVLRQFGVEIKSIKATIGPTITLYEIVPSEGTCISKIRNLEDDIALLLAAKSIRIIVPISGKGTIGIEVPNKRVRIVSMESVINSYAYQENQMDLPCAIGKTQTNEVFLFDLTKAPHLLIGGATGQGKSMLLHAIIASLLYKKHPAELKFVLMDFRGVELGLYSSLENHFLACLQEEDCIITDVQKAVKTLGALCALMDKRYDLLRRAHARNVKEYNEMFKNRCLNPEQGHEFMPYIVVVIDEFGYFMMEAGKEVELPICRIAQLARAVGIHMIISTQRATNDIITGAIKVNFPTRISFRVSEWIDSQVILDCNGAEELLGNGDMLFRVGKSIDCIRVQGALLDTAEIRDICQYISCQQCYLHPMFLPETDYVDNCDDVGREMVDKWHLDPMFADIAKFVVNNQCGSTSLIQRNYSIGYNRAGKIMDQLEKMGVAGPQIGAQPREILITDSMTLESLLSALG